mmetsp:Transcript_15705/g.26480  ORF Transcript_15705/g.26480 Transcript_15705/m.26480 type:complete len:100 (-) Transcript_15705:368-667(-)
MLLIAVDQGYLDIVKFLLEEIRVDVNEQTTSGESALHRACYRNRQDILRYLLDNHSPNMELRKVSTDNYLILTPLYEACLRERVEAIDLLLSHGANIDI